jgi:mono/diheme cytochrome c family protein
MRPLILFFTWLGIGVSLFILSGGIFTTVPIQPITPTPTIDRLEIPVLSAHPSQVEIGSNVYYYHCMPCHGDQGQGLTDEWRGVWDEEHQNCWGRGCHSIRDADKTFTIPTVIPSLVGNGSLEIRFSTPEKLFSYLKATHPPQSPGILKDDEYWALTAFLLSKNGIIPPQGEVGPLAKSHADLRILGITCVLLVLISVVLLGILLRRKLRLIRIAEVNKDMQ